MSQLAFTIRVAILGLLSVLLVAPRVVGNNPGQLGTCWDPYPVSVPDVLIDGCQPYPSSPYACDPDVLSFQGTGGGVRLSTCEEFGGAGMVRPLVSATCDVEGFDGFNSYEECDGGGYTSIACDTEVGTTYYVSMPPETLGPWTLVLEHLTPNGRCLDAETLSLGVAVTNEMHCAGLSPFRCATGCSSPPGTSDVFYKIVGNGMPLTVTATGETSDFRPSLSVSQGGCGQQTVCLIAAKGMGDTVSATWCSELGVEYILRLLSYEEEEHEIVVEPAADPLAACPPEAECTGARLLASPSSIEVEFQHGVRWTRVCHPQEEDAAVRWYRVVGTGSTMTASLCPEEGGSSSFSNFPIIAVIDGSCSTVNCSFDGADFCNDGTYMKTTWDSVAGHVYHLVLDVDNRLCTEPVNLTLTIDGGVEGDKDGNGLPDYFGESPAPQDPCFNAPPGSDCTGFKSGCGGDGERIDVALSMNQTGYGAILTHSGQEMREEVDLFIAGKDHVVDLAVKRRHLTGVLDEYSPFGPAWGCNYRQVLEVLESGDVEIRGYSRKDLFTNVAPNVWEGGTGRMERLMQLTAGQFTLRMSGGSTMFFLGALDPITHRMTAVMTTFQSPNQNAVHVAYETPTPNSRLLDRKLLSITDSYGRLIQFHYDSGSEWVTAIEDFSGRRVTYSYDGTGQLLSVTSPSVESTGPALNDYPNGKTTTYTYWGQGTPADPMYFALASVTRPREAEGGGGAYLTWTYDGEGRVATHRIGAGATGGTYSYSYQTTTLPNHSGPVFLTQVTDRRGTETSLYHTQAGQVLREVIHDSLRAPEHGGGAYVRTFTYDEDGDLLEEVRPNGTVVQHEHASDLMPGLPWPRTSEANTRAKRVIAGGEAIESLTIHEPIYNQPFQVVDPRGFETGNDPEQFTTTFVTDYMEDLESAATDLAPALGLSRTELWELFDEAGLLDLLGDGDGDGQLDPQDLNGDGDVSGQCGNRIQVIHPTVTLPDGTHQDAAEIWRYNRFGQVTYHRDAEGFVTLWSYHPENDPDGDGSDLIAGAATDTGGYLKEVIRDAISIPDGRTASSTPRPVEQRTVHEYGEQSHGGHAFPANPRGVATAITDPRGIKSLRLVNELDQVVITVSADEVPPASPPLTAYQYETVTLYDLNDQVMETRVENENTLDPNTRDWVVTKYERDVLNQVIREERNAEQPNGQTSGSPIVTTFQYDASENLIRTTKGFGSPEEAVETWVHDARDLAYHHVRHLDANQEPDPTKRESRTTTKIDENGNVIARWDATSDEPGVDRDATLMDYDAFDRLVTTTDRVGNQTIVTHDDASNVIAVERRGRYETGGSPDELLSKVETKYDERNRAWQVNQHLFHHDGREVGTLRPGANSSGPALVTTTTVHDALGRIVEVTDAEGDVHQTVFDGLSRVIETIDPVGNRTERVMDASGNLLELHEHEVRPGGGPETYVTTHRHDALNRLVQTTEPNGQVTTFEYDSRNNLTTQTDALGNVVETVHDPLDRVIETRIYLGANGVNGSPSQNVGVITKLQSWDALNRLTSRTDDNGNVTSYVHDDLGRQTRVEYEDETHETWRYNLDDELLEHQNQRGQVASYEHDAAGRKTSVTVQNPVAGTASRTWTHDGLDRVLQATDDNGGAPGSSVSCEYWYDSLSRVIQEAQVIDGKSSLAVGTEWEGTTRKVSTTYPNGRIVTRQHDALDRTQAIQDGGALIAQYSYVGPGRVARIDYGNGAFLDKLAGGYDDNRRHRYHAWRHPTLGALAVYLNEYDGPGGVGTNRRIKEVRLHGPMAGHVDTYVFDSAYRMTSFKATHAPPSHRTFDGADKMLTFIDEGIDRQPAVDQEPGEEGMNQYSSFDWKARTYDDNGALSNDGTRTYAHDYWNRIVRVNDVSGGVLAEYLYASDNRRVLKRLGSGEETRYVLDGWQVVEERDGDDVATFQHVDGLSIDDHVQVLDLTTGQASYYHGNSQGSVGAITNESGFVTAYVEYGWLGEPTVTTKAGQPMLLSQLPGSDAYLFQGRRHDAETGLYYYRNRYYDAAVGEFVTIDPLGNWQHGQGNGYDAFGGDPWNRSDPMGLFGIPQAEAYSTASGDRDWEALGAMEYDQAARFDTAIGISLESTPWIFAWNGYKRLEGMLADESADTIHWTPFRSAASRRWGEKPAYDFVYDSRAALTQLGLALGPTLGRPRGAKTPDVVDCTDVDAAATGGGGALVRYDPEFALRQGADATIVVPDSFVVVRGGTTPIPGGTFSGSVGRTVTEAGVGVPHGTIRGTTAGRIRADGGVVELAPEMTRAGTLNPQHVNVTPGGTPRFGLPQPNPVPKRGRMQ